MDDAGTKVTTTEEIVVRVDPVNFQLAWRYATPLPRCLFYSERWQIMLDGHDGPDGQTTSYETWDTFGGIVAYVVRWFMRANLQSSYDAMSRALKERAERAD
jgi:hypothetical protein